MTSKSSFLVNLRTNARRRTWNTVLFATGFFFLLPVSLFISLSSTVKYTEQQYLAERLTDVFKSLMILNPFTVMTTIVFAVIAAIHGFSYLYSKKKVDMYLSVPVTIERRFAVIFANSVLMFVIPYFIFFVISLVIWGTYGIENTYIIKMAVAVFGMNVLLYLAVYGLTSIAVMLTGNLPVTVLGTGVLLGYENGLRFLLMYMFNNYFVTYSSYTDEVFTKTWISPVGIIVNFYTDFADALNMHEHTSWIFKTYGLHFLVLAVIFMAITFMLYKIRPSESSQKSMAFRKTRTTIKRLMMIPFAVVFGTIFDDASGHSLIAAVFGIVAGIIIGHVVIQAIYDQDLKAAFKDKRSVVYAGVIALAVFGIFRFDFLGYDKFIPNESKLESGAVTPSMMFINRCNYYDSDYKYLSYNSTLRGTNMQIKDKSILTDIAYVSAENVDVMRNERVSTGESTIDYNKMVNLSVRYRMSNGKDVYRQLYVPYESSKDVLEKLFKDKDFKTEITQLYSPQFDNMLQYLKVVEFSNGYVDKTIDYSDEFLAAYRKDFMNMTLSDVAETTALGYIDFAAEKNVNPEDYNDGITYITYDFPLFASFENTIRILEEQGIDVNEKMSTDIINSIVVHSNYDDSVNETITDKETIQRLIDASISNAQDSFSGLRYGLNDNYYLELNYDYGKAGDYITNSSAYYLSDKAAKDILGISE